MKFTTLVDNLKQTINLAERITGKNLTLPVLSNVLLATNKNELHVLATDLELGIQLSVPGKIEEEGQVVIPAKIFSSFLNTLTEEKITLENEKQSLKVKSGNYESIIQGINPEDFPIIPEVKTEKYIEIDKNVLKDSINQVLPSIGYINSKPELNGVFLSLEKNSLKFVGTDSFRLAETTLADNDFKTNIKEKLEIIIPLKTMQEVVRIASELDDLNLITIYPDVNQIQFIFKNTTEVRLVSRLINAKFPEYQAIIPKDFEIELTVNKKDFSDAIRIAGLFTGKINDVKLTLKPNNKKIIIEAQDPTLGKSQNIVEASYLKGKELEISFNYRFLLDGINSIKDEIIFVGLNKEINPGLFRSNKDHSFIYILMPIKNVY
ncbi:MAG: DNA polymerase III subunit beta [Minisyncoccia bacterium]|jgi:DNA polymerase-3 subunit beta